MRQRVFGVPYRKEVLIEPGNLSQRVTDNFDASGSLGLTGFSGDASAFRSELSGDDATGTKEFGLAGDSDLLAESLDYEASDISWKHASIFDKQLVDEPVV